MAQFLASNTFPGDGVRTRWAFAFAGVAPDTDSGTTPYLFPSDVRAEELYTDGDNQPRTLERTVQLVGANEAMIVGDPVAIGRQIRIYRKTEIRFPLVDYRDRQTVDSSDLDMANRQAIFLAQETIDAASYSWSAGHDGGLSAGGAIISDVGDGYQDHDAVNVKQLFQAQLDTLKRTLHTQDGETDLMPMPLAAMRAGKVLTFDDYGQPKVVAPVSGSATDLATALASTNGVQMVGNAFDKRTLAQATTAMEFAGVQVIMPNVAALRTLDLTKAAKWVGTTGYYTPGDGGHGVYLVATGGTLPDNGGTVLKTPTGNLILSVPGRLNIRQWGCKGDGVTDDTVGYMAAVASKLDLLIPRGVFIVAPVGPENVYPGGREANRTSGAQLSSSQTVLGLGDSSVLQWKDGATVQAFFGAKNCIGAWIKDIKFVNGYSSLIVDSASDYAVRDVGVINCTHQGQLIGVCAGLQTTLAPDQSKLSSGLYVINSRFLDIAVHGVVFSNTEQYSARGNTFRRLTGGYCIDSSHGSRGGQVVDNNAHTGMYFWKAESSLIPVVPGGVMVPEKSQCRDTVVSGNTTYNMVGECVLINSWSERLIVVNNCFHGSKTNMITFGMSTGGQHPGTSVIANNTLICDYASDSTAINHKLDTMDIPVLITGNIIYAAYGIDTTVVRCRIMGNCIRTRLAGIIMRQPGNRVVWGFAIEGNDIVSAADFAINVQKSTLPFRAVSICNNYLSAPSGAVYGAEVTGWQHCDINNNKYYSPNRGSLPVFALSATTATSIQMNRINCPTDIARHGIRVYGAGVTTMIQGNISTLAVGVDTPDTETSRFLTLNITTAGYLAQT